MQCLDLKEIGERIFKRRKQLGYTREKLAEITGRSPKFCSDIERGIRGMSSETLYYISKSLNVSADYILDGGNNENSEEINEIVGMLQTCGSEKIGYIKNIVSNILMAIK